MKFFIFLFAIFMMETSFAGPCNCPWNVDKRGRLCGKRSAFCRAGGAEPQCGAISTADKINLKSKHCY